MIAKITPIIRLPKRVDVFDYFIPDELRDKIKIGQLVEIPWRRELARGVVLSLASKQESNKFRARPITSIMDSTPLFTNEQLRLIQGFSKYYFCTLGSIIRLIAPYVPVRKVSAKEQVSIPDVRFSISKSQLPNLAQSVSSLDDKINYINIRDISSFVWLVMHLSKLTQGQLLVLVPQIEMLKAMHAIVQKLCSGICEQIHSELNKNQYWNAYKSTRDAKAKIIFSTRQGVFLPIQANSTILFFESSSDDFKQYDQHPKYDSRIVASWLAGITKSKLIFTSSSELISNKKISYINLPSARTQNAKIKLVDMEQEMTRKDFSIISGKAMEHIQETFEAKKKVVILSLREKSEKGVSVEALYNILTKSLKSCNISINTKEFDVLVATPSILEGLKLSSKRGSLGLLIFASIEPLLAFPDYRSSERAYYRLMHWKMMAQELGFSELILQSYSTDSKAVRAFAYGEKDAFIQDELKNRRELNYPPFTKLIKLSNKGSDASQASIIKDKIKQMESKDMQVLGPFKDKKNHQSILIKLVKPTDLSMLTSLPKGWSIDRDPENPL